MTEKYVYSTLIHRVSQHVSSPMLASPTEVLEKYLGHLSHQPMQTADHKGEPDNYLIS